MKIEKGAETKAKENEEQKKLFISHKLSKPTLVGFGA